MAEPMSTNADLRPTNAADELRGGAPVGGATVSSGTTPAGDEPADGVRALVSLGSRILGANGHDDFIWGHASVRDVEGRGAWMKSSGIGLAEVREENVVLVDSDGAIVDGDGVPHVEYPIHTEIYASRPDVGAVVHSHPPYAVALGASGQPLRAVSHGATAFVPPDVPRFTLTANLITTRELGRALAQALGPAPGILMVNHGIVAVGRTLPTAVVRAIVLERACAQQLLTAGFGGAEHLSDDAEALAKREVIWSERSFEAVWHHLARLLPKPGG